MPTSSSSSPSPPTTLTLALLLPLLTSTSLLSLSLPQYLIHSSLLRLSQHDSTTARTISRLWRQILPAQIGADLLLSIASLVAGIRLLRMSRGRRDMGMGMGPGTGTVTWWVSVMGTLLLTGRTASLWWMGRLGVAMAGAYERVGIWIKDDDGGSGEGGEVGNNVEAKGEAIDEIQAEAMEQGRDVQDVVDEKVIELQKRWVRGCGWRVLGIEVPIWLCFGWVVVRGGR